MKQDSRMFYGWWVALAVFFTWCTYAGSPFGVILKQLMVQFNSGRGEVSLIPTVSQISSAASAFIVSRLVRRWSPRKFMLAGLIIVGTTLLLCSLAKSLWYLYAIYFFTGIGWGMSGAVVVTVLLSRWFVRKRGLAVGLVLSGFAIGSMPIVPLVGWIAGRYGWQATYLMAGSLILIVGIPLTLLIVKDSPQQMGLLPDGDKVGTETGVVTSPAFESSREANIHQRGIITYFNRWPLWLISISFFVATMGNVAIIQHEFSFVTDIGMPSAMAASAFGFTMGLGGIGGFVSGWITDKMSPRYVAVLFLCLAISGVFVLSHSNSTSGLWLFVILFGLASGASGTLLPLIIGDIFGSEALAIIFGSVNILYVLGGALGPPLAGFIFDATGSYARMFLIVILFYLISAISIYFAYGLKPRFGHWR